LTLSFQHNSDRAMDAVAVVENAYDLSGDGDAWLQGVCASSAPLFDSGIGAFAFAYDLAGPTQRMLNLVGSNIPDEHFEIVRQMILSCAPEELRAYCGTDLYCGTGQQRFSNAGLDYHKLFAQFGQAAGLQDAITATIPADGDTGVIVAGYSTKKERLNPQQFHVMQRIMCHVGLGFRLRRRLTDATNGAPVDAILSPSGKLEHAEGSARDDGPRELLRESVTRMEKARGSLRRENPLSALELWRGLVTGRWSLVDHFDSDGRRFLLARRNAPRARPVAALTPREEQVLQLACRGYSNKLIGYELGLTEATISTHLAAARKKLGCSSRSDLVATAKRAGG
jgi:DNA-binding CsgD family transcriptional regulator